MNPRLSSFLSSRLLDRREGHRALVLARYRKLQQFGQLSVEARREWQSSELAKLLNHAKYNVPFYRERLKETGDISPHNVWEIFASLPVVTRAMIKRTPEAFCAEHNTSFFMDATGGSTGTPLQFRVDGATQIAREASLMWGDSMAGWRPGQKIAMLWGADRDVRNALATARLHVRCWVENRRWFNAFDMGPVQMQAYHHSLQTFCPYLLVAYAGAANELARYLQRQEEQVCYPRGAVVCSAEMLTDDMRMVISQTFQKPVFDRYGNREFGVIAAECREHVGLHINDHDLVLELLADAGSSPHAQIVVTHLGNYAMPFIRYNTEDAAQNLIMDACLCGCRLPRLTKVLGRQSDIIRTRSGRYIHGEFFTHLLYPSRAVQQFSFVQEAQDRYRLRMKVLADISPAQEACWLNEIQKQVGGDPDITIEYVDQIPSSSSGKRRYTYTSVDFSPPAQLGGS